MIDYLIENESLLIGLPMLFIVVIVIIYLFVRIISFAIMKSRQQYKEMIDKYINK